MSGTPSAGAVVSREEAFGQWRRWRGATVPSEDEVRMKRVLRHSASRHATTALLERQRGNRALRAHREHCRREMRAETRATTTIDSEGHETSLAFDTPLWTLADLPRAARALVLEYLPVVPAVCCEDLCRLCAVLAVDDGCALRAPDATLAQLDAMAAVVERYEIDYGAFAVAAWAMGLVGRRPAGPPLPSTTHILEAAEVLADDADRVSGWAAALVRGTPPDGGSRESAASVEAARAAYQTLPTGLFTALRALTPTARHMLRYRLFDAWDVPRPTIDATADAAAAAALLSPEDAAQQALAAQAAADRQTMRTLRHPQRAVFDEALGMAVRALRHGRDRFRRYRQWALFRESLLHSTCFDLRPTVRASMARWEAPLRAWQAERADIIAAAALADHQYLLRRVPAIEFIGGAEMDDLRAMFAEVDVRLPEGVDRDVYPQTLTVAQSITLGIIDIPWVRGYAWEDRTSGPVEATASIATAFTASSTALASASRGGSVTSGSGGHTVPASNTGRASFVAADGSAYPSALLQLSHGKSRAASVVFQLSSELALSRSLARSASLLLASGPLPEADEAVAAAAAVRAEESARLQQLLHARAVAADRMTQRIWRPTLMFKPRACHAFGGCELCAQPLVHWLGLVRPRSGACEDVVLCEGCYEDEYGTDRRIIHAMFDWFRIRDLINLPRDVLGLDAESWPRDGESSYTQRDRDLPPLRGSHHQRRMTLGGEAQETVESAEQSWGSSAIAPPERALLPATPPPEYA